MLIMNNSLRTLAMSEHAETKDVCKKLPIYLVMVLTECSSDVRVLLRAYAHVEFTGSDFILQSLSKYHKPSKRPLKNPKLSLRDILQIFF